MDDRAIIGVDFGQAVDHSAISIGYPVEECLEIRHIEQLPLGQKYDEQIKRISKLFNWVEQDTKKRPFLIVDGTGVGRAVIDLMRTEELYPDAVVTVTGGNTITMDGVDWHIPKKDLIYPLITGIQNYTIYIAKRTEHAVTLIHELQTFRLKVNISTGNESFEAWREKDHDDLVFACALCVYSWSNRVESGAYVIQKIPSKYHDMNRQQDPFLRHRAKYR